MQQAKFVHNHKNIVIKNFNSSELDSVKDEVLEIENVVSIHRTNLSDRNGRWMIQAKSNINEEDLKKIDNIINAIPMTETRTMQTSRPMRVLNQMDIVGAANTKRQRELFPTRPPRQNWNNPLIPIQINLDDATAATGLTQRTDLSAIEDQIEKLKRDLEEQKRENKNVKKVFEAKLQAQRKDYTTMKESAQAMTGAKNRIET